MPAGEKKQQRGSVPAPLVKQEMFGGYASAELQPKLNAHLHLDSDGLAVQHGGLVLPAANRVQRRLAQSGRPRNNAHRADAAGSVNHNLKHDIAFGARLPGKLRIHWQRPAYNLRLLYPPTHGQRTTGLQFGRWRRKRRASGSGRDSLQRVGFAGRYRPGIQGRGSRPRCGLSRRNRMRVEGSEHAGYRCARSGLAGCRLARLVGLCRRRRSFLCRGRADCSGVTADRIHRHRDRLRSRPLLCRCGRLGRLRDNRRLGSHWLLRLRKRLSCVRGNWPGMAVKQKKTAPRSDDQARRAGADQQPILAGRGTLPFPSRIQRSAKQGPRASDIPRSIRTCRAGSRRFRECFL